MKIYIDTLGCPKNLSDSEHAAGLLVDKGHKIAKNPASADVILINTCGFIKDAKEESIDRILQVAQAKRDDVILVVSGCLSQRYKEEFAQVMPEANIVIGVNDYQRLPDILDRYEPNKQVSFFNTCQGQYREIRSRYQLEKNYSSYLKIAEGCNNVCSYCIIPYIRGGYRSRKMENILEEAQQLVAKGAKELIIIAQDVTAYGLDLYGELKLPRLLEELSEIEGLHWIRLMYCYEEKITDYLIEVIRNVDKICKYIDIPIQHASDRILKSMNRKSTRASIENTINKLRERIPDIHIRTTLITGFPGERVEDAQILEDVVKEMKFERLGVFAYSKEEGTLASQMDNQISDKVKSARKDRLMLLQREISLDHNMGKVGSLLEVLVEGFEGEGRYIGRTAYDAPEIDNKVIFTSEKPLSPGEFAKVKILDGFDYDLWGHAIEKG